MEPVSGLSEEQLAQIEANRERAKKRRLERFLESVEQTEEEPLETRQAAAASFGGGFIPDDDDDQREPEQTETPEMLFPLELNDRCKVCGSFDLDHHLQKNYRVAVCLSCRDAHPDRFSLITKTRAREEYLLTDEELRDESRMPHISKPNPLRPNWSDMQLFLREQVKAFALEKWGSEAAILEEAQRRVDAHQSLKERKYTTNLKELRMKTKLKSKARPTSDKHVHVFEETRSGSTVQSICKECGFKVISEDL